MLGRCPAHEAHGMRCCAGAWLGRHACGTKMRGEGDMVPRTANWCIRKVNSQKVAHPEADGCSPTTCAPPRPAPFPSMHSPRTIERSETGSVPISNCDASATHTSMRVVKIAETR